MKSWFWRPHLAGALIGGAAAILTVVVRKSEALASPSNDLAIMVLAFGVLYALSYGVFALLQGRRP